MIGMGKYAQSAIIEFLQKRRMNGELKMNWETVKACLMAQLIMTGIAMEIGVILSLLRL
ncbi:MAG: hypothetical protein LBU35_00630 [Holosporales bacterium]|jgi:hypothetical protein|nr:hypothetical protein [Holosporales bacterium]